MPLCNLSPTQWDLAKRRMRLKIQLQLCPLPGMQSPVLEWVLSHLLSCLLEGLAVPVGGSNLNSTSQHRPGEGMEVNMSAGIHGLVESPSL